VRAKNNYKLTNPTVGTELGEVWIPASQRELTYKNSMVNKLMKKYLILASWHISVITAINPRLRQEDPKFEAGNLSRA